MKILKDIFVVILIVIVSSLMGYYQNFNVNVSIAFVIIVFFILNIIVRKSLLFKGYFTSRFNLFTSKVWSEKLYDIPKGLMFEKIIEVINESDFKLAEINKDKYEILATSKTTLKSWGENLYISLEEDGNKSLMRFCSATFFQMYSWGKNEKNYDDLLNKIESSLII